MSYFSQNKTTVWILVAILFFNIAAFSAFYYKLNHQKCEQPCEEKKGHFQDYLNKELNLTTDQAKQFDIEKKTYRDTVMQVHKAMKEKREYISSQMKLPVIDTAKLYTAANELGALYAQTRKLYINHYIALSKICTPEQKKKLASIIGRMFCDDCRKDGPIHNRKHRRPLPACEKINPNY